VTDQDLAALKSALRAEALVRRGAGGDQQALQQRLIEVLAPHAGQVLSGYWPMRGEPDPRPAMDLHRGPVCLPVVTGRAIPLIFRAHDGQGLVPGVYGTWHPAESQPELLPSVLIVPLLAFDRHGMRLGYGGGYYDRTLALLRKSAPVTAIGLAFAGQEADRLPVDRFDQPLDLIVTDRETIIPVR
jgi:5-formyltetrahydrofolate cyclo-ligase